MSMLYEEFMEYGKAKNSCEPYCVYHWPNGFKFDTRIYKKWKVRMFEFNKMVMDMGLPTSFDICYFLIDHFDNKLY